MLNTMSGLRAIVLWSLFFLLTIRALPETPPHPPSEFAPRLAIRAVSSHEGLMDDGPFSSPSSASVPAVRPRPLDQKSSSPLGSSPRKAVPPSGSVASAPGGRKKQASGSNPQSQRVTPERQPAPLPQRPQSMPVVAQDPAPVAQNSVLLSQDGSAPSTSGQTTPQLNAQAQPQGRRPPPPVEGGQCVPGRYYGTGVTLASRPPTSAAVRRPTASRNRAVKRAVVQRRYLAGPPGTLNCAGPSGVALSQATWRQVGATGWLREYWTQRRSDFPTPGGFTALTRRDFLNDGTSICQNGESCDITPCVVLNLASVSPCDRQPALHVLTAQRNIKNTFEGFLNALQHAIANAALTKDAVALRFYDDQNAQDYSEFQVLAGMANFAVGLILPAAPVLKSLFRMPKETPDAPFFYPQHLIGSMLVYILSTSSQLPDSTPILAARSGEYVRRSASELSKMMRLGLTDLLEGRTFGTKTFLDWTDDGSIMDFHGYKGDQLTEFMTTQINNIIINLHWTQMRVFIIGGWPCNQDPELGKGPDEGGMCDEDGLAWYILYLKADPVGNHVFADKNAFSSKIKGLQDVPGLSASNRRWGFVQPPPGMQYMGVPPYEGVTYKNVIRSSLFAWKANKGNKFSGKFANQRFLDLVRQQNGRLGAGKSFWEGYHIPVCHAVGIDPNMEYRNMVVQPYNKDRQVRWCGPICSDPWGKTPQQADPVTTKEFLVAAHLWGYAPIIHKCNTDPPWGTGPEVPLLEKPGHYLGKLTNPQWWVANPSL